MLINWFGEWMFRVADIGSRFALQLFGVSVASVLALSVPSTGNVVDHTNATVGRLGQAAAAVAPNLMHNGVRVADVPVMKTVAGLNPGPIDSWYPMDGVRQVATSAADVVTSATGTLRTVRILLPCRGVACTGIQP